MSRLFEALSALKTEHRTPDAILSSPAEEIPLDLTAVNAVSHVISPAADSKYLSLNVVPQAGASVGGSPRNRTAASIATAGLPHEAESLNKGVSKPADLELGCPLAVHLSPASRLVSLTDSKSIAAEKFRALVARLQHIGQQRELKSVQVTSSMMSEGKTLVSANLAVTLAKFSSRRTLLIEGDLHRPALASLLGVQGLPGLSDWWPDQDRRISDFLYHLGDIPLWVLSAGEVPLQPLNLLQSTRFAEAFAWLSRRFDWIIVDSTPMLPVVDANLWSRLVDGTIVVVREGMTTVKVLKKGLQALDNPKLVGVVVNNAREIGQAKYEGQYYSSLEERKIGAKQ